MKHMQVKQWEIVFGIRWYNIKCILHNGQRVEISSFPSHESALNFAITEGFLLKDQIKP